MPLSLRNRRWIIPSPTEGAIDALVAAGAGSLAAPILAARAIPPEDVEDFLKPTLRSLLPNPSLLQGMDVAADTLAAAIAQGKRIAIWSDYDVDGATSAAVLGWFLRGCGVEPHLLRIPDRLTEGYGPNTPGLLALQDEGAELVCILDAGTTAFEPLEAAHHAGLPVIVVDHHAAEDTLPKAVAVVNPNRRDQLPGLGHLCAAGVVFLLSVAVNTRLRKLGHFPAGSKGADLMGLLDLVALGTVCDVVSLTGLNRAFVTRGLPILSERARPGIAALAEAAACGDAIGTRECGFALGPRINAGGRIGDSKMGAMLLLARDADEAIPLAQELSRLNNERQEMERSATKQALEIASLGWVPGETRRLAIAIVDGHEGVVGISAARVKEALDAPAFVLAAAHDGTIKGSGRSVTGFDLGAAVLAAKAAGLLIKGGGHAMAAGITLDPARLDEFRAFMDARIAESDYAQDGIIVKVDMGIPIRRATIGLVDAVQNLAPFGMGNPTPRFAITGALLGEVRVLKDKHLKCLFLDPQTGMAGPQLEGIIWNEANTPFADALRAHKGQIVDAVGGLEINEWRGKRSLQMKLEDVRVSQGT